MPSVAQQVGALLDAATPAGRVSAYLFGSHARGTAHRKSDIDLGLVLDYGVYPTGAARFDARLRLATELSRSFGSTKLDVIVLNDVPPTLARRVCADRSRVYCSDPKTDRDFQRDTQLKAPDLQMFLDRTRRIKLAALYDLPR